MFPRYLYQDLAILKTAKLNDFDKVILKQYIKLLKLNKKLKRKKPTLLTYKVSIIINFFLNLCSQFLHQSTNLSG